jgi:hypothetical protein
VTCRSPCYSPCKPLCRSPCVSPCKVTCCSPRVSCRTTLHFNY